MVNVFFNHIFRYLFIRQKGLIGTLAPIRPIIKSTDDLRNSQTVFVVIVICSVSPGSEGRCGRSQTEYSITGEAGYSIFLTIYGNITGTVLTVGLAAAVNVISKRKHYLLPDHLQSSAPGNCILFVAINLPAVQPFKRQNQQQT